MYFVSILKISQHDFKLLVHLKDNFILYTLCMFLVLCYSKKTKNKSNFVFKGEGEV